MRRLLTVLTSALAILITVPVVSAVRLDQDQELNDPRSTSTTRPVIMGRHHAVSSMKPQATDAAMRTLEAGGNAFDATVAGHAVLALTDPAMNGYGSDAVVLLYDAKTKKVVSINAEGPAPRLATIEWYQKNANGRIPSSDSLLSAIVPGVIDAWYTLLDRWGTMTFAQVLQPAIEVAEGGFPLTRGLANSMNNSGKLKKYPTSVKLYQPSTPWREGDLFKNLDAARLLRRLVEAEKMASSSSKGGRRAGLQAARDRFYKGDIAKTMAEFAEAQGGLFRYEDFASYSVQVEEPVKFNYRGYDVYKNPSASQGPAELFALNILENYDLKKMGLNSADYIHTTAEAVKLGMGDREKFLGDATFTKIPYEGLLAKPYGTERKALIDPNKAAMELRPGDPSRFMTTGASFDYPWSVNYDGDAHHEGDTSYIAVVDKDRNMVSFEPSNHSAWGTGVVMADLGIIFTCRGDYFTLEAGKPYTLEPGKRPRSTLQSTLVMKDGLPFMITGSPGGDDQIMRTIQTLLNVIDFGMNVQEAIEAPRWSTRAFPASSGRFTMVPGDLSVESRIPVAVQEALKAKGHRLGVSRPWSLGSNAAIIVDPRTGVLKAGADPRVDAYAGAR